MNCRHCGAQLSHPFLDLGSSPPSNAYLNPTQVLREEIWFPLRIMVCESCWLVQTEDYAGRESLFSEDYAYFSSYSTSWLSHAQAYLQQVKQRFALNEDSMVVEIAANDGYLLQYVKDAKIPCYGIEPTKSTARAARDKGLVIVEEFFGLELAERLTAEGKQADLIVANNVLAHVPDINDFVMGFHKLLKPQGVCTFEFPHLPKMVSQNQFDTAYHEHYSYLSFTAVFQILQFGGLEIFDVEELETHGGSLRVFAQSKENGVQMVRSSVSDLLNKEVETGVKTLAYYLDFQKSAISVKHQLLDFLLKTYRDGKKICAYGAAAKGNTLFNFAGVRADLLPFVVDKNPAKIGKFLPGSRIPVLAESDLKAYQPDLVLILPWNLSQEIRQQLSYISQWQGRFVTAVPNLQIFEAHI